MHMWVYLGLTLDVSQLVQWIIFKENRYISTSTRVFRVYG